MILHVSNVLPEAGVAGLLEHDFSSPSSSLSLCVCLASLPVIPSPYAHPAFSVALLTRCPCVSVSETHLLSSQHLKACCPICLPLSISTFIVVVTSVGHINYYRSKGGEWVTQVSIKSLHWVDVGVQLWNLMRQDVTVAVSCRQLQSAKYSAMSLRIKPCWQFL